MSRKTNEENERIKRAYHIFLAEARRCDQTTCLKSADAILRFEKSTGYKSFKAFHIEQVRKFKQSLNRAESEKTGKPLSKATISGILRSNKAFFEWLSQRPGYKSRIAFQDAEYLNQNAKDARVAHAQRPSTFPTLAQCRHAFDNMPESSEVERRNKAFFACLMITGARIGALSTLRLKHVDLVEGMIFQDARDVNTKASKTFVTYLLPVDPDYRTCFEEWVKHLRDDLLFGHDDPLFPPPNVANVGGAFAVKGFKRTCYQNGGPLRGVIKDAFASSDLPQFSPHSFRKTLVRWADKAYLTREGFKAFSQNIGHDNVATTVGAYYPVSQERQAELIRKDAH